MPYFPACGGRWFTLIKNWTDIIGKENYPDREGKEMREEEIQQTSMIYLQ